MGAEPCGHLGRFGEREGTSTGFSTCARPTGEGESAAPVGVERHLGAHGERQRAVVDALARTVGAAHRDRSRAVEGDPQIHARKGSGWWRPCGWCRCGRATWAGSGDLVDVLGIGLDAHVVVRRDVGAGAGDLDEGLVRQARWRKRLPVDQEAELVVAGVGPADAHGAGDGGCDDVVGWAWWAARGVVAGADGCHDQHHDQTGHDERSLRRAGRCRSLRVARRHRHGMPLPGEAAVPTRGNASGRRSGESQATPSISQVP